MSTIHVQNDGEQVKLVLCLDGLGEFALDMSPEQARGLSESLKGHSTLVEKNGAQKAYKKFPTKEEKAEENPPSFEYFINDINKSIKEATQNIIKNKKD